MPPMNGKPASKHYPDSSFNENIELTRHIHDGSSTLTGHSAAQMAPHGPDRVNVFIVFVFILELIVLVFVSVLEYFLRATDVFPVRRQRFSCTDQSISLNKDTESYDGFAYEADISYEVVIGLSFTIPPAIVVISEIAVWAFSDARQKTVRALCRGCKVPQVLRRILRFIGAFIFGILVTMVFTDVAKIFTGRLRPNFLETCRLNSTLCGERPAGHLFSSAEVCLEESGAVIREGRLSFPSLHTAVTAFSAAYLAVYLHNVVRSPGARVVRPFMGLAFVILTLMCGLARIGLNYSHWTDVLAGLLLGLIIAIYICCFVLNNFRERMNTQQFYATLKNYVVQHRLIELRDLYKENWLELDSFRDGGTLPPPPLQHSPVQQYSSSRPGSPPVSDVFSNGMVIPRPHVHANESHTDPDVIEIRPARPPGERPRHRPTAHAKNTFQRDLNRAVDNYRSTRDLYPQNQQGHM